MTTMAERRAAARGRGNAMAHAQLGVMSGKGIDAMHAEIAATVRARSGLPPLDAGADAERRGAPPSHIDPRRPPPAARRPGPQSQAEIDAVYSEIAARLNATLPAHAVIPAREPGRP